MCLLERPTSSILKEKDGDFDFSQVQRTKLNLMEKSILPLTGPHNVVHNRRKAEQSAFGDDVRTSGWRRHMNPLTSWTTIFLRVLR